MCVKRTDVLRETVCSIASSRTVGALKSEKVGRFDTRRHGQSERKKWDWKVKLVKLD